MAVDFSKIFSQKAPSTPFAWTDSEYLQGWDVIQNTPPTRQQFNALQMVSDEKALELYNTKAPIHSPVFTGDPQAPTPAWNDNDTSIATTAFVRHWADQAGQGLTDVGQFYFIFGDQAFFQYGEAPTDSNGVAKVYFPVSFPEDSSGKGIYVPVPIALTDYGESFAFGVGQSATYRTGDYVYIYTTSGQTGQPVSGVAIGVFAFGLKL